VFFFDEAHLLFADAEEALVEKIEQVVRLIRSKGVGVSFVTQNPLDIPETVLGQLGNRVQHALRAFTPRDQKAVKSAADTLRANPKIKTDVAITELAVGEALVSFLDEKGAPAVVERAWILPPASRIGPLSADERAALMNASVLRGTYAETVDRESAYEKLQARAAATQVSAAGGAAPAGRPASTGGSTPADPPKRPMSQGLQDILLGTTGPRGGHHEGMLESAAKSAARSMGSGLGRQILRGVLGSMFGGKR
jgi:DNA helicase HerA-like ATPase